VVLDQVVAICYTESVFRGMVSTASTAVSKTVSEGSNPSTPARRAQETSFGVACASFLLPHTRGYSHRKWT
jgi:hypothetical protein